MNLSIIIVSWNVKELLRKCLKSIFEKTQGIEFEIIVVDNASNDGSAQMVLTEFPKVALIASNENLGFARGNNMGFEQASGKYVLFMNPDMELVENSFPKLIELMDKNPNIALSTCQLIYPDGALQRNVKNNPGTCDQILILLKLHHFFQPKCLKKYLAKGFDYTKEQEVKQIMGAFIFADAEILKKLEGWDSRYFVWWEDLDLCKRVQDAKYKILYTPITKVMHYEAKAFEQQQSFEKQIRFNRGMRIYFRKHKDLFSYSLIYLFSLLSLILACLSQILKIKPKPQSRL